MLSPLLMLESKDGESAQDLWQAAELCLKLGRITQSMKFAHDAVKKDSSLGNYNAFHLNVLKLAAELYEEVGNYNNAMFYWQKLTESSPQDFEAWHGLGVALANLERYREADTALVTALNIQPQNQKVQSLRTQIRQ